MFKVVWAAWRAPKQAAASDGTEPLLLSRAGSAGLDSSLPAGINGSGGLHSGLNGSSAAAAMGGTGGVGGGMGRRTQSLQWLNAAAEARVAGGRLARGGFSGCGGMVLEEEGSLLDFGLSTCTWPMALPRRRHPALPPRLSTRALAATSLPTYCGPVQAAAAASASGRWRRSSSCCACCPCLPPPRCTGRFTCRRAGRAVVACACCAMLCMVWLLLHAVDVHTQQVIDGLSSLLSFVFYTQPVIVVLSPLLRHAIFSPPAGHLTALPRHCSTCALQMGSVFAQGMRARARPPLSST